MDHKINPSDLIPFDLILLLLLVVEKMPVKQIAKLLGETTHDIRQSLPYALDKLGKLDKLTWDDAARIQWKIDSIRRRNYRFLFAKWTLRQMIKANVGFLRRFSAFMFKFSINWNPRTKAYWKVIRFFTKVEAKLSASYFVPYAMQEKYKMTGIARIGWYRKLVYMRGLRLRTRNGMFETWLFR